MLREIWGGRIGARLGLGHPMIKAVNRVYRGFETCLFVFLFFERRAFIPHLKLPRPPSSAEPYLARSSRHDGGGGGGNPRSVRGPRPVQVLDIRGAPCTKMSIKVRRTILKCGSRSVVVTNRKAFLKSPKPYTIKPEPETPNPIPRTRNSIY